MKKLFKMEKIHSTILSMYNREISVLGLCQIHQCLCNSNEKLQIICIKPKLSAHSVQLNFL